LVLPATTGGSAFLGQRSVRAGCDQIADFGRQSTREVIAQIGRSGAGSDGIVLCEHVTKWSVPRTVADLVERLDLRGAGAALGDHDRSDGLDVAVTGLARTLCSPRQGGVRGFDSVGGIGLAGSPSCLAVGAVDLDDVDAAGAQEPSAAGALGAGALHTDASDRPERGQPANELVVARC
jgi:hypothetical protein